MTAGSAILFVLTDETVFFIIAIGFTEKLPIGGCRIREKRIEIQRKTHGKTGDGDVQQRAGGVSGSDRSSEETPEAPCASSGDYCLGVILIAAVCTISMKMEEIHSKSSM